MRLAKDAFFLVLMSCNTGWARHDGAAGVGAQRYRGGGGQSGRQGSGCGYGVGGRYVLFGVGVLRFVVNGKC